MEILRVTRQHKDCFVRNKCAVLVEENGKRKIYEVPLEYEDAPKERIKKEILKLKS